MANDTKKSNNHNRFYVVIAVVVWLAAVGIYLRGYGNDAEPAELYQRTDSTVGAVEKQHENVGRELDTASGQLDAAGAAVGRADDLVDRSQECVVRNAEIVIKCQQIVRECRKIVKNSNRIYAEVEETNRTGAGSGCR